MIPYRTCPALPCPALQEKKRKRKEQEKKRKRKEKEKKSKGAPLRLDYYGSMYWMEYWSIGVYRAFAFLVVCCFQHQPYMRDHW
jgi:hypothetical protein